MSQKLSDAQIIDIVRGAIAATLESWIRQGAPSGQYINSGGGPECGCCVDFADEVEAALHDYRDHFQAIGVYAFISRKSNDDDNYDGNPFDRSLLAKHWPAIVPPVGLTWDDLDALSADAGFGVFTHYWIYAKGLHFDAECGDGVKNFFDLPFFRRVIESWQAERKSKRS